MQQPNREIAALFVSSPLRLKTLFTKPLKFVIQLFTDSSIEHAASYCKGLVLNMSGKGGELMKFEDWIKEFAVNGAKIHCIEATINMPPNVVDKLYSYNQSCIGKKYDAIAAAYSAIDEIKQVRELDYQTRGTFCSQQCFDGFVEIGLFSPQKDMVSPAELKSKLIKSPYFENQWRRLN